MVRHLSRPTCIRNDVAQLVLQFCDLLLHANTESVCWFPDNNEQFARERTVSGYQGLYGVAMGVLVLAVNM